MDNNSGIVFFNTLGRQKQLFSPLTPGKLKLYTCGPTVYDYAHIGNLRYFVFVDTLVRMLLVSGFEVEHVMNITDVGHLTSDEDFGEDKMLKGAKRESEKQGREFTVWDVAQYYTDAFLSDRGAMNVKSDYGDKYHFSLPRATEHIASMIDMISNLEQRGLAYRTDKAVYFDVTKFPKYTELSGQKLEDKEIGTRDEVVVDPGKKHPADFRLWQLDQPDHAMQWEAPWGKGFPGWHLECSAMAQEILGDQIDIHTGGVDHIPVHHTNEIAQSEGTTGKKFANYWLHLEFLKVDGEKMSKSKGSFYILEDIKGKGFDPLVLRYFYLGAHYRTPLNFTWEGLEAAQNALQKLQEQARIIISIHDRDDKEGKSQSSTINTSPVLVALQDDLNTPEALAALWEVIKGPADNEVKYQTLLIADRLFGLNLTKYISFYAEESDDSMRIRSLSTERFTLKKQKEWEKADSIRKELEKMGYSLIDFENDFVIVRNKGD